MSFLLGNSPIPITDRISNPKRVDKFGPKQDDPLEGRMSDPWVDYFSRLVQTVQQASTRVNSASKVEQDASISATDLSGSTLRTGLYRVTYYARITRAAGVSSSLDVTFSWTDGGVAQSQTGAVITGNTTTSLGSATVLIHADGTSPIRYATTYASAGAPTMQYRLDVVLELIQA